VKIPLGIFFHPDLLSPNRRRRLFKHLSGDSLAAGIPGSRRPVLSSAWGFLSSTWFSPWMRYCPKSLSLGSLALVLDLFGPICFSIEWSMFLEVVSYLGNLALNLVYADLLFPEIFASIS
jgi:hypothetical protein